MKLLVVAIEAKKKHIKFHHETEFYHEIEGPVRGITTSNVTVDLKLQCVGSGSFDEYITKEGLDKERFFTDILSGKLKVQFGPESHEDV